MKIELMPDSAVCLSETCIYNRECANHASAGDYRTEDGFTPELDLQGNQWVCLTADRPTGLTEEYRYYGATPNNIEELGQGFITLDELRQKMLPDYNI
jgi:hypothetical protein